MTLIELMLTVAIIAILISLLLPAIAMVRRQAANTATKHTIEQVAMSLDTYRSGDAKHRYPPPQSDEALALRPPTAGSSAVLALLEEHGLPVLKLGELDDQSRLVDAWQQPYRYTLTRPTVSDPQSLQTWNYDPANSRVREWGPRWDGGSGKVADGPLPHPYLYSLGVTGLTGQGADWIHLEDAQ